MLNLRLEIVENWLWWSVVELGRRESDDIDVVIGAAGLAIRMLWDDE